MAKIDGATLAKMMERLGKEQLVHLEQVEFDDGESDEALSVISIHRDYLAVKAVGGKPKNLSRAKAAAGSVDDPKDCLRNAIQSLLGESFSQRAARLLGDSGMESKLKKRFDGMFRDAAADLVLLPDDVVVTISRLVLKQDVPEAEIENARKRAVEVGSKSVAEWLMVRLAMPLALTFVKDLKTGFDPLAHWKKAELQQVLDYDSPHGRFKWPDLYLLEPDAMNELRRWVSSLAKGGYAYALSQAERRNRLDYLFLEAPAQDFDDMPGGSCGRLRLIVFGLTFLVHSRWGEMSGESEKMVGCWREDLAWLKERYYVPHCSRV